MSTITSNRGQRGLPPATLALPLLLLLAGCAGGGMDDLKTYVTDVKARPGGRIEPPPGITPPETVDYVATGLPDPFSPFTEEVEPPPDGDGDGDGTVQPPMNHVREELEQFPLDTLRMVGTLERDTQNWGLVTAPDGAVHRVQPGNYVGKNYGKITTVAEDRIELVEIVPDGQGRWQERVARMDLTD
jgi:type IV pilus assembly protein PilP